MRSAMDEAVRSAINEAEERGMQQGHEYGWHEACENMARAMLKEELYSKKAIMRVTQLPKEKIDELESEVL